MRNVLCKQLVVELTYVVHVCGTIHARLGSFRISTIFRPDMTFNIVIAVYGRVSQLMELLLEHKQQDI